MSGLVGTTRLGRTGPVVSRMGLGLAALGRPGYITLGHADDLGSARDRDTMERAAHTVLDAAWSGGVRYFDAARSYGLAEAFLASWLASRRVRPAEVVVGSKWGYTYTAGWRVDAPVHEVKDHTLSVLARQLGESRSLLGAHLALYQIHSATLESGVLDDDAVIDALADLRASGLLIGLSVSGPLQADTIARALEIRRDGACVFGAVQATWNLLERAAEPALREAHAEGLGVIVKEALANGRLTARGVESGATASIRAFADAAERHGLAMDVVALAAALAQPWADIVLSGATTVAQVESNLGAALVDRGSELLQRLEGVRMESNAYWEQRASLPWN